MNLSDARTMTLVVQPNAVSLPAFAGMTQLEGVEGCKAAGHPLTD